MHLPIMPAGPRRQLLSLATANGRAGRRGCRNRSGKGAQIFSGIFCTHPHAPTHIDDRTYTYDANGNQNGWTQDHNGTRRTIA